MLEKIQTALREYKEDDNLTVSAETSFEELELDSLDTVELVMNLEDIFDINIKMDPSIKTVGDLMAVIEGIQNA